MVGYFPIGKNQPPLNSSLTWILKRGHRNHTWESTWIGAKRWKHLLPGPVMPQIEMETLCLQSRDSATEIQFLLWLGFPFRKCAGLHSPLIGIATAYFLPSHQITSLRTTKEGILTASKPPAFAVAPIHIMGCPNQHLWAPDATLRKEPHGGSVLEPRTQRNKTERLL